MANNTTVANPIYDLEIVKIVDSTVVYLNDNVIWTIKVIIHGPSVAVNVVVEDTLPEGLKLINAKASVGNYSNGIWKIGDLEVTMPVTLELTTQAVKEGNILNVVTVNSTTPDSNKSNNVANNTTEVDPVCDLEITKLVNTSCVNVTDKIEWTIIVVNNGPSTARNVKVSDVLPKGLKLISANPSVGSFAGDIWTIGDLDANKPVSMVLITQAVKEGNITNVLL
ncbi:DUF11 domain-containing protein [Methanobrevibacter sp.]|uniref:DUF11 domain-containing protein n=1 Tax=Methanobrevibacter sp. TaxID=66852 RepID=UPI003890EEC2